MKIQRIWGSETKTSCSSQILTITAVFLSLTVVVIDGRNTAMLNCLALECDFKCRASPIGGECFCPEGKQIANDSKTCIDRNDCLEWGFCDQSCKKTKGSYTCGCYPGYTLQADKKKCAADGRAGPLRVYVTRNGDIVRTDPERKNRTARVVVRNAAAGRGVDYHHAFDSLVWLDAKRKTVRTARLSLDDAGLGDREIQLLGVWDPVSMAVDWIGDKLYVVDGPGRKIDVFELKIGGGGRSWHAVVLSTGLTDPSDIALDPTQAYAFVADDNRLVRVHMDGGDAKTIVAAEHLSKISGVSADVLSGRVYWCDSRLGHIETVDYDGNGRHLILSTSDRAPSRLAVFENTVYWSDYGVGHGVLSVDKYDPATVTSVYEAGRDETEGTKSVRTVHPSIQKQVSSPCKKNNAGCLHMCLVSRGSATNSSLTYKCVCSVGFQLAKDMHNCVPIEEFLLYSQQKFIKGKALSDVPLRFGDALLPIMSENASKFVGLDFDVRGNYIYYSDGLQDTIYRTRRNGTGKEIVLASENDGVEGIAVDWAAKNLYYVGSKSGTINVLSIRNANNKNVLLKDMKRPKAIAVHPNKGYIFFTEWNRPVSIVRAYTDGSNLMVLPDIALGWPNGLTVDYATDRLYWCDSLLNHVQHSNLHGTDVKTIDTSTIRNPSSIVTHYDWLYIADGRTNAIVKMHKLTGAESNAQVRESQQMYSVKIYSGHEQFIDPNHPCTDAKGRGNCQKLCFAIPSGASTTLRVQCGCPSGEKIHEDGKTCVVIVSESAAVDGFFK